MSFTQQTAAKRHAFTILCILASSLLAAHARIGEKREDLNQDAGRYGLPTGASTPMLTDSLETVDVFQKDKFNITTEYDKAGKVWRITFQQKDLPEKLMTNLIEKNGGDRKWANPVVFRGNKHWISEDKEMHAVYYGNPVYTLVIMTTPALKAERVPQKLEGRETKRVAEDATGEAKPEKKTEDPLEGF